MGEKLRKLEERLPEGDLPRGASTEVSLRKIKSDPVLWANLLLLREAAEDLFDESKEGLYHHGLLRAHLEQVHRTVSPILFRHVVQSRNKLSDGRVWQKEAIPHRENGVKYELYRAVSGKAQPVKCRCALGTCGGMNG